MELSQNCAKSSYQYRKNLNNIIADMITRNGPSKYPLDKVILAKSQINSHCETQ